MGLQDLTVENRRSNIELLRIIAMLCIVASHFGVHSGFSFTATSPNQILITIFAFGGKFGVNIFVLISGYFLISGAFSLRKFSKLLGQIGFYGIAIAGCFLYFHPELVSLRSLIRSCFAPLYGENWFAYTYTVLYLLTPFLNACVKRADQKPLLGLLGVLTVIWSVLPTFTAARLEVSPLAWFIYLYLVGAYIRLYPMAWFQRRRLLAWVWAGCFAASSLLNIVLGDLGMRWNLLHHPLHWFYRDVSFFLLAAAVSAFLLFLHCNISYHAWINRAAATTFGVYLIHDHEFVRKYIWNAVFHNQAYQDRPDLWLHALWVIPGVFIACSAVDWLRIRWIERPLLQRCGGWLDRRQANWLEAYRKFDI